MKIIKIENVSEVDQFSDDRYIILSNGILVN